MIVMGVVLVSALFLGAIVFLLLLGIFVVGYSAFWLRAWWRWRTSPGRMPSDRESTSGTVRSVSYIDGDYEVVEADADAAGRGSGTGI